MKFYNTDLSLSKKAIDQLRDRKEAFKKTSKTKKYLINTIVTTYGYEHKKHSIGIIDNVVTINDMIKP